METVAFIQEVAAPFGIAAATITMMGIVVVTLWLAIRKRDEQDRIDRLEREEKDRKLIEYIATVVANNTNVSESLIERFDDFVRNGNK